MAINFSPISTNINIPTDFFSTLFFQHFAKIFKNFDLKIDEDSGILEIYGWVGFSFENFEFAWRLGVNNEVEYTTENAEYVVREAAVLQAAKKEGQSNASGFRFKLPISSFESGQEVHLLVKNLDTDEIYCFCELKISVNGSM